MRTYVALIDIGGMSRANWAAWEAQRSTFDGIVVDWPIPGEGWRERWRLGALNIVVALGEVEKRIKRFERAGVRCSALWEQDVFG